MSETVRLEEFTGILQNKMIVVWHSHAQQTPWTPSEFLLSHYITRVLITGRSSPISISLSMDASWTQVWRSPGAKEWSCVMSVLQHMPGPVLLVVGPDVGMTASLNRALRGHTDTTVVVLRTAADGPATVAAAGWVGEPPDQVFFPVMDGTRLSGQLAAELQSWASTSVPRHMDLRTLLPQLAAQEYALTAAVAKPSTLFWYKPSDSPPITCITVAQVAKQIQCLGAVLEKLGAEV